MAWHACAWPWDMGWVGSRKPANTYMEHIHQSTAKRANGNAYSCTCTTQYQ